MCGIIGIVSRPSGRTVPTRDEIITELDRAVAAIPDCARAADHAHRVDALLRGDAGVQALAGNFELATAITSRLDVLDAFADDEERRIEEGILDPQEVENAIAVLTRLRDASWALRRDRLRTADAVHALAGRSASTSALRGYLSIQQALSAIDRMEVRGRDSAGITVIVWGGDLAESLSSLSDSVARRSGDPLFTSGSVRLHDESLVFAYKAAAEIGELGDNTRAIRAAVAADDLLRSVLALDNVRVSVVGHTRWASVGIISEPNAHPVNSEELGRTATSMSVAVLNGDVDNHADLRTRHSLVFAEPITTDAKVIPSLVERFRSAGESALEAFRHAVTLFEGSVAIALSSTDDPGTMYLALHGSGQGLCVGLAEDRFVIASEPYGLVEETLQYVRMDGEALAHADQPSSRGQIVVVSADGAGTLDGLRMVAYDGTTLELSVA